MADLAQFWKQDLSTTPSGDIATVDGQQLGVQRVLRRLLTNPGDYIWHPTYGAGLPSYIGKAVPIDTIKGVILSQIFQEAAVAQNPAPIIAVTPIPSGMNINIQYWDATSGAPQLLNFDITP